MNGYSVLLTDFTISPRPVLSHRDRMTLKSVTGDWSIPGAHLECLLERKLKRMLHVPVFIGTGRLALGLPV